MTTPAKETRMTAPAPEAAGPPLLRCDACGGHISASDSQPLPQLALAEHMRREHPADRLPLPIEAGDGTLDLDALEAANAGLRVRLEGAVRAAALQVRQARGRVVAEEDTYDLVRRLMRAQEALTQTAEAFKAAAAECRAQAEEELLTARGEQDGIPAGRMIVPAGPIEYVVAPEFARAPDRWDTASLFGVLADLAAAETDSNSADAAQAALAALTALWGLLASPRLASTKVDALRRQIAAQGDDGRAAALGQARVPGEQLYKGVKVTAEEPKARRRS